MTISLLLHDHIITHRYPYLYSFSWVILIPTESYRMLLNSTEFYRKITELASDIIR